jgi:hypothetical protein
MSQVARSPVTFQQALRSSICIGTIFLLGCGTPPATTVNDAPFREAVAQYLQANNMAMKIKDIKQPPAIEGNIATMTASMTHEQLGGPSVTWTFQFAKQPTGDWQVTKHED